MVKLAAARLEMQFLRQRVLQETKAKKAHRRTKVVTENSKVVASRNRSKHKEAEGNILERLGSEKMKKNTSDNVEERRSISSRPGSSNSGEDRFTRAQQGERRVESIKSSNSSIERAKTRPDSRPGNSKSQRNSSEGKQPEAMTDEERDIEDQRIDIAKYYGNIYSTAKNT